MKTFLNVFLIITLPGFGMAKSVILKDGNKFEAVKITEDGDRLTIQTNYENLFVNKVDVENLEELGFANKSIEKEPKTTGLEFISKVLPDGSIKVEYFLNKEKIGTQLFKQYGTLLSSDGKIMDGTYKEFYPNGKVKKEKTVINERDNGPFKSFYPNGTLYSEAYFANGKITEYKIYLDSGQLIMAGSYISDVANNYFREFDESNTPSPKPFNFSEPNPSHYYSLDRKYFIQFGIGKFSPSEGNSGQMYEASFNVVQSSRSTMGVEIGYRQFETVLFNVKDIGVTSIGFQGIFKYLFIPKRIAPYIGGGFSISLNGIDSQKLREGLSQQYGGLWKVKEDIIASYGLFGSLGILSWLNDNISVFIEGRGIWEQREVAVDMSAIGQGRKTDNLNAGGFTYFGGIQIHF